MTRTRDSHAAHTAAQAATRDAPESVCAARRRAPSRAPSGRAQPTQSPNEALHAASGASWKYRSAASDSQARWRRSANVKAKLAPSAIERPREDAVRSAAKTSGALTSQARRLSSCSAPKRSSADANPPSTLAVTVHFGDE